ncbi:WD repeat-containing protein 54-like [Pollicipes pollicipes]|uniref:WD repeat-containing protein 54-like n=1 Tax=Pollicipes pollicipes TaxID=41117 RepID=UPI001885819E|nr:WD repeat-containing protein 54-like [Pollicipes pollicipes]
MYEREKTLLLTHSCAAGANSLAVRRTADATWLAWPHQNQISLVKLADETVESRAVSGRSEEDGQTVLQVRWCELKNWTYLVAACSNSVDFYNQHASMLLFSFPYTQEGARCFTRGLAAFLGKACVGTSDGSLLVFQSDSGAEGELHLGQRVRMHASAICALAADERHLVSADETGNIVQWAGKGSEVARLRQIDHYGAPCTALTLTELYVVAAYGSGHLRLFNRESGQIRAEATAHARWITGLTHKFTEREANARLVGAGFLRSDGATFGLAAYDQKQLFCYAM